MNKINILILVLLLSSITMFSMHYNILDNINDKTIPIIEEPNIKIITIPTNYLIEENNNSNTIIDTENNLIISDRQIRIKAIHNNSINYTNTNNMINNNDNYDDIILIVKRNNYLETNKNKIYNISIG